jgi:S-formylglutathione hydrolase FrmB
MALLHGSFFSHAINVVTNFNVIYPEGCAERDGRVPTLYLLHGYKGDYSCWVRRTNIERYASRYRVAVVMPEVHNSFYCDLPGGGNGYKYWTYASEELLTVSRRIFRLSAKREDTFVAGLSMGGFGAFKMALNRPDVFGAAASLSGALDMDFAVSDPSVKAEFELCMGDIKNFPGSVNDLFYHARKLDAEAVKPRLYQACGTEDFLYEANAKFRDMMKGLAYDYTYEEGPGGHDWDFWDAWIQRVLEWLTLEKIAE